MTLSEALDRWRRKDHTVVMDAEATTLILNAALAVVEGTRIQWCEVHGETHNGKDDGSEQCWAAEVYLDLPLDENCAIVTRVLVDPETVKQEGP